MLSKHVARDLLPLVNTPDSYDILTDYAKYRITSLQKVLEQSTVMEDILRTQGQIMELRRLLGLRDEANQDAKG